MLTVALEDGVVDSCGELKQRMSEGKEKKERYLRALRVGRERDLLTLSDDLRKSRRWCDDYCHGMVRVTGIRIFDSRLMLCRRVLAHRLVLSRNVSSQPTGQDILVVARAYVSGNAFNPITNRTQTAPTPQDHDRPPLPGPQGYASSKENPMSRANIDAATSRFSRQQYRFDCHSTRNNTITTLSSVTYLDDIYKPPESKVIAWYSGGSVGFKKGQRAGYEAGYQCAIRIFKLLEEFKEQHKDIAVHLYFKGFGQGREALKTALMASEGDKIRDTIKCITDRTAIKIGGTRSKKTRRL